MATAAAAAAVGLGHLELSRVTLEGVLIGAWRRHVGGVCEAVPREERITGGLVSSSHVTHSHWSPARCFQMQPAAPDAEPTRSLSPHHLHTARGIYAPVCTIMVMKLQKPATSRKQLLQPISLLHFICFPLALDLFIPSWIFFFFYFQRMSFTKIKRR